MNLRFGLPSGFEACGLIVRVRTGAAFWMWLSARMAGLADKAGLNLLEQAIESIARPGQPGEVSPAELGRDEARSVYARLVWFMRGGKEPRNDPPGRKGGEGKGGHERLLDYEKDLDAIYAAFLQSYGLDLYTEQGGAPLLETMHWWRFLALVNNLQPGSMLVDYYMHYRGLDVRRLPRKSAAERECLRKVIETKRQGALSGERERKRVEPAYVKRARELKERGRVEKD